MKSILELKNIERTYQLGSQIVTVLKGVNLKIPPGKLVVIKGPSGSGKTTILNLMGGLDKPTQGQVIYQGKYIGDLSERELTNLRREEIGFIFQTFGLIQSLTAFENVELPLRILHVPWKERMRRTKYQLKRVGLSERADHRIQELSGGEQQRVGIARALITTPELILADEPTGEVDFKTGAQIMQLFQKLVKEQGMTICLATHDPLVMEYADLVFEIYDGTIIKSLTG